LIVLVWLGAATIAQKGRRAKSFERFDSCVFGSEAGVSGQSASERVLSLRDCRVEGKTKATHCVVDEMFT
jgi:hypothetical protein